MAGPVVSVVIPVYNASRYVERAVQSALDQSEVGEVMLAEDGSTDGSLAACEALARADGRVRVLQHPGGANFGAGASRNLALAATTRPLVAFLDADDWYLPRRFERPLELLIDPQLDGVYEAIGVDFASDEDRERFLATCADTLTQGELTTVTRHIEPASLCEALLAGQSGYFSLDGLVIRRTLLDRCGPFDPDLRLHQDTHWILRAACAGRLAGGQLDRAVAVRRVHSGNRISRRGTPQQLRDRRRLWRSLLSWAAARNVPKPLLRKFARRAWWEASHGQGSRARWLAGELAVAPVATVSWLVRAL